MILLSIIQFAEELRKGPEGTKKYASALVTAVPDRKLVHDDILAKGDRC